MLPPTRILFPVDFSVVYRFEIQCCEACGDMVPLVLFGCDALQWIAPTGLL
jgi:hypothetical protein